MSEAISDTRLLDIARVELSRLLDDLTDASSVTGRSVSSSSSRIKIPPRRSRPSFTGRRSMDSLTASSSLPGRSSDANSSAIDEDDDSFEYDEEEEEEDELEDDGGVGLELAGLQISRVPPELIDLMGARVNKLSLNDNWLTTLPSEFQLMSNLKYLDIGQNKLTSFPQILCLCPALEILDISGNQLKELPRSLGNLNSTLKVLWLAHNMFEYLPPCLADVEELRFLELEGNPLILPPPELSSAQRKQETDDFTWIQSIQNYLASNRDHIESLITASISHGTTHGSAASLSPVPVSSSSSTHESPDPSIPSVPPIPVPAGATRSSPLTNTEVFSPLTNDSFFDAHEDLSSESSEWSSGTGLERLRSNSESQVSSRAAKRMGFIVRKKPGYTPVPPLTPEAQSFFTTTAPTSSATLVTASADSELTNQFSHLRGQSHDSVMEALEKPRVPDIVEKPRASRSRSGSASTMTSPVADSAPGEYFKRLSTLPEEMRDTGKFSAQLTEAARKVLFSLHEFHDIVRRCSAFCSNHPLATRLNARLVAVRSGFPDLVKALEAYQNDDAAAEAGLVGNITKCIESVRLLAELLRSNVEQLVEIVDIKFVRSMIMVTYTSLSELHNAWNMLEPRVLSSSSLSLAENKLHTEEDYISTAAADDQLYDRIYVAANSAQTVMGQLTEAINKSTIATVQSTNQAVTPASAARMKDIFTSCITGLEITRGLKQKVESIRETGKIDRRKFWEDTHAFLSSVIAILAATKSAMNDWPFLAEARSDFTTLTRVTKEIPLLLEYSSYKVMMGESAGTPASQAPPSAPQHLATTPLVAALGPAAQAVMSPLVAPPQVGSAQGILSPGFGGVGPGGMSPSYLAAPYTSSPYFPQTGAEKSPVPATSAHHVSPP